MKITKPEWIDTVENRLAQAIPVHPNIVSVIKLLPIIPLLLMPLQQGKTAILPPWIILSLFLVYGFLDYLDGTVARQKDKETYLGRILDCITDYPVLLVLSYLCLNIIPVPLLAAKLILYHFLVDKQQ